MTVSLATSNISNGRIQRRRFVYGAIVAVLVISFLSIVLALTVAPDLFIRLGVTQLETAAGIQVGYRTGRIRLRGVVLTNVALELGQQAPSSSRPPTVLMDQVVVRPSFLGLITGRRGQPWTVLADLYEGSATLAIEGPTDAWTATLHWSGIDVSHVHPWQGKPDMTGLSDGRISVSGQGPQDDIKLDGAWSVAGAGIVVDGIKTGDLVLPPITLSTLRTTGVWTGRRATVTTLDAGGPLGRVQLSGKLVLRTPLEKTGLNMKMTYVPSSDVPTDLGILLRIFLPQEATTGTQTYHVAGTLAMPMVTAADGS